MIPDERNDEMRIDTIKRHEMMALDKRLTQTFTKGVNEIGVTNAEARWMFSSMIDILERHLDRIETLDPDEKFKLVYV